MSIEPVDFSRRAEPQPRLTDRYVPGRHADTYWRDEEDDLIRAHYPNGGLPTCMEKLPRRSQSAIYARAQKLGVRSLKQSDAPRKRHRPDPEFDARIREAWPDLVERGALQRWADSIGVDRWVISKRAAALGLTKDYRRKEPPWTAAEDALMTRVPLNDCTKAAKIFAEHGFKRSATAIMVRAKRVGLSRRRTDILSARGAAKILGVDDKWISSRCIDGSLPAEKRGTQRLVQQGGDTWAIRPDALRTFVIERLEEIDIRKVEKFAFVALLTNPDPEPLLTAAE